MIVGVVLSVPATPLAQRARRRDFRLGEPPRQRRQGPEDAEVIKPGAVPGSVFSAGPPGPPQPRPPGPAWPAGPRPGYRHGHIPPAHARDQPESARGPVAGLEEQNDLLDRWVRLVYHARVHTKKSRRGRGWHWRYTPRRLPAAWPAAWPRSGEGRDLQRVQDEPEL